MIFFDLETTGLNPRLDKLHGIGISLADGTREYFLHPFPQHVVERLASDEDKCNQNILFDMRFLIANGYQVRGKLYDTKVLAHLLDENGANGLDELMERYFGAGHLPNYARIQQACEEAGVKHVGGLCALDLVTPGRYTELIGEYCIEDIANTEKLFNFLKEKIKQRSEMIKKAFGPEQKTILDYAKEEALPFLRAQLDIELGGVVVDVATVERLRAPLQAELDAHCAKILEQFSDEIRQVLEAKEKVLRKREVEKRIAKAKTESHKAKLRANPESVKVKVRPFSPGLDAYVADMLFGVFRLPIKDLRRTKKGISVDENTLRILLEKYKPTEREPTRFEKPRDFIKAVLNFRETHKLLSTYIGNDGSEGEKKKGILGLVEQQPNGLYKVFPQYSQGTVTGRLNCKEPNIQNIPRDSGIKEFFKPEQEGKVFIHVDASQLELRIAAHLSMEPGFVDAYREGRDLHRQTASRMFGRPQSSITDSERQGGKTTNFLLIFFGGPARLQESLREVGLQYSIDDCKAFREAFFAEYQTYKRFGDGLLEDARRRLMLISEAGRVRRLPELAFGEGLNWKRKQWQGPKELRNELIEYLERDEIDPTEEAIFQKASRIYSHAKKQAYNFPIQSLGATITKHGIMQLRKAGYVVRCTVHDSIDIEVEERKAKAEVPKVLSILNNCYRLRVPLVWEAKILRSFSEKDKA